MPFGLRPDGDLAYGVPATRRIMPFIMSSRTESAVYFEQQVDCQAIWSFVEQHRARTGQHTTFLHLLIWAFARTVRRHPRLNRFTAGRRLYQRRGVWVSFSAKKEKSDDSPVSVVKRQIDPDWTLAQLVEEVTKAKDTELSDAPSSTDRELGLLLALPTFMTSCFVALARRLDAFGMLPAAMIRSDPLFASVFIANLGSIGMDAGFHHLYEWGNIPIFITVGQRATRLVPGADGRAEQREMLTLRYTFDERVEDGLYCLKALASLKDLLENPAGTNAAP